MSPVFSVQRSLVLLLSAGLILGCFSGCGKSRTKLPDVPTEPAYLVEEVTPATTEATTAPTETEATEPATTEAATEPEPDGLKGTIAGNLVNIRSGPGTNYGSHETLEEGEPVLILEVKADGGLPWGRIDRGWVCLNYVKLEDPDALLSYTASAVGISIHNGIHIYDGPGSFYEKVGTLDKNVRLNIFGIFGNWARIMDGWILVDHVYLDGTEGPEEPQMGTVTANAVSIRSGPGTEYGIVAACNTGARVKILYQTTLYGYGWGCTESGWICMEYVLLDQDPAAAILGTWYGHTAQSVDEFDHIFSEWNFRIDGTYTRTKWYYNEKTKELSKFQDGSTSGKFTFDGTKFLLDEGTAYVEGGKLYLNEGYGQKTYVKTSMEDAISLFLAEKYPPTPDEPEGGETPPEGGETPPEGGETPPEGGETPPEGGETPPEGGETPPEGGETPPEGGSEET